jgi:hypothetical protein
VRSSVVRLPHQVDLTKPLFDMTLTGDTTIPSTVPEPGTLALVAGGALVLIARRRLTKR